MTFDPRGWIRMEHDESDEIVSGEIEAGTPGCCGSSCHEPDPSRERAGACCGGGGAAIRRPALLTIGPPQESPPAKLERDCMLCGEPLVYFTEEKDARCEYCGQQFRTAALCERGHYVCDRCHAEDGV